ncbi:hypothetical protein SUGI_0409020 [Cryptomeria japonica]|nr:hypothetical protein SUGI_0409020 [Cryptomeria japonica]
MGSRLKTIGIVGPSWCVMCMRDEESTNHVLYNCPVVSSCWEWFLDMVELETVKNAEMKDFLSSWPNSFNSKWGDIWLEGSALLVWHVWKERNKRIFKEISLSNDKLILMIKGVIEEVVSCNLKNKKC